MDVELQIIEMLESMTARILEVEDKLEHLKEKYDANGLTREGDSEYMASNSLFGHNKN